MKYVYLNFCNFRTCALKSINTKKFLRRLYRTGCPHEAVLTTELTCTCTTGFESVPGTEPGIRVPDTKLFRRKNLLHPSDTDTVTLTVIIRIFGRVDSFQNHFEVLRKLSRNFLQF